MREFERYAQPPSPQMELPGLGMRGELDMEGAEGWKAEHPEEWRLLKEQAVRYTATGQKVSMRDLVSWLRISHHVKVVNGLTPAMARLMETEEPKLSGMFTKARAACDGWGAR